MLEKIGLPAKPSMRGGNWVIDASHCQGCSSQFTFINRKHHCRRCGGLFCNNCTLQRMVLRGQGDSPARICDPCKRLEEAARFELRYGHRNRTAKGSINYSSKHEDEVIGKILGTDGEKLLSGLEPELDAISVQSLASSSSSSNIKEDESCHGKEDFARTMSSEIQSNASTNFVSASPEELRQRAVDEKKKYKILKAEGKSAEALQAFKRGKELERQAGVLEIALRKSRRLASKAPNSTVSTAAQNLDGFEDSKSKQKMPSLKTNEAKTNLEDELKELGWSDADIHDSDAKPKNLSLEGELSNLLGEFTRSSATGRKKSVDKSEVTAIKKRALLLKREGKLAEAKEELKKAKILEKKLEEQELLGESEESEDEISALIRSMDEDKQDDFSLDHASGLSIGIDQFNGLTDDLPIDKNLDVTDYDMNDPELAAALKSFGWSEEDDEHAAHREENQEQVGYQIRQSVPLDRESLQEKVLNLKKEALNQKRAGNVSEAKDLLKRAKLLEGDLEILDPDSGASAAEIKQKALYPLTYGVSPAPEDNIAPSFSQLKTPNRSKISIQRELLALKKRALTLRREGRMDEAEEELNKGKYLEQQLDQMENATKRSAPKVIEKNVVPTHAHDSALDMLDLGEEAVEAEVTEEDMLDPSLMSALHNLGWDDDDVEPIGASHKKSKLITTQPLHDHKPSPFSGKVLRSKGEIQKELLAIKRRALALRRQGKTAEVEEELEKAKALENQMTEMENATKFNAPKFDTRNQDLTYLDGADHGLIDLGEQGSETGITDQYMHDPSLLSASKNLGWSNDGIEPVRVANESSTQMNKPSNEKETDVAATSTSIALEQKLAGGTDTLMNEILAHKRKALALKREGKLVEAREELRQAKLLERSLEHDEHNEHGDAVRKSMSVQKTLENDGHADAVDISVSASASLDASLVQDKTNQKQKPLSGRDRFRVQQESLSHKRNALKLRREGKLDEAESELELAKSLEKQLEDSNQSSSSNMPGGKLEAKDELMEDLLDPQLMSALKAIGIVDTPVLVQSSKNVDSLPNIKINDDRASLEGQIKADKLRALNLKKAGKQAEALEALRSAKRLEKKLASLG